MTLASPPLLRNPRMAQTPGTTRLTVELPDDLMLDLRDTIQWGLRRWLIIAATRLVVQAVKQEGQEIIGHILAGSYRLVPDVNRHNTTEHPQGLDGAARGASNEADKAKGSAD